MANKTIYDDWVASRREVAAPAGLTDRIMSKVEGTATSHPQALWLLLFKIEQSRLAQCGACAAAGAVGCIPFVYLAYVARFLTF